MDIPRFLPDVPFPPYTYVPKRTPHPVSDPHGHMSGEERESGELNVDDWPRCRAYLRGIDLFNHGYYWEAHEVWESLWHAAGRRGPVADFLKGLIKLAAAGVKAREGSPTGCARHARRAAELFKLASRESAPVDGAPHQRLMGLSLETLADLSQQIAADDSSVRSHSGAVGPVFPVPLCPEGSALPCPTDRLTQRH